MSEARRTGDPLAGRRASLERLWARFKAAGGGDVSLSDDLVAERRTEAAADDRPGLRNELDAGHGMEDAPDDGSSGT